MKQESLSARLRPERYRLDPEEVEFVEVEDLSPEDPEASETPSPPAADPSPEEPQALRLVALWGRIGKRALVPHLQGGL